MRRWRQVVSIFDLVSSSDSRFACYASTSSTPTYAVSSHLASYAVMLGLKATMAIVDNSGGLVAECINVLRYKSSVGLGRVGEYLVKLHVTPVTLSSGAAHQLCSLFPLPILTYACR